jgi:hypothetical protein
LPIAPSFSGSPIVRDDLSNFIFPNPAFSAKVRLNLALKDKSFSLDLADG